MKSKLLRKWRNKISGKESGPISKIRRLFMIYSQKDVIWSLNSHPVFSKCFSSDENMTATTSIFLLTEWPSRTRHMFRFPGIPKTTVYYDDHVDADRIDRYLGNGWIETFRIIASPSSVILPRRSGVFLTIPRAGRPEAPPYIGNLNSLEAKVRPSDPRNRAGFSTVGIGQSHRSRHLTSMRWRLTWL
jgi:hypothetical protein